MYGYKCDKCGKGIVRATKVNDYKTKIDGIPFTVENAAVGVCDQCGAKYFNSRETRRWRDAFFREQLQRGGILAASEISDLREEMGLNIADFALLIGCSRQALYLWESPNRETPQSRMADSVIKLVRESFRIGPVNVIEFLRESLRAAGVEVPNCAGISTHKAPQSPTGIRSAPADVQAEDFGDFDSLFQFSGKPTGFSPRLGII